VGETIVGWMEEENERKKSNIGPNLIRIVVKARIFII
jgi:hypothetical protein